MSIFKSIFGDKGSNNGKTMTFDQAADIVGIYGEILEHKAQSPCIVADVSNLPYSKAIIKQAIITLLSSNPDVQIKEHLLSAYWLLASWQEGVGNTDIVLDSSNMDLSANLLDSEKKWTDKVETERQQLFLEIQKLGYL